MRPTQAPIHDRDHPRTRRVVRDKDGRRNQYRIERHLRLRDPISRERTVGEMLDLLVGVNAQRNGHGPDRIQDG
jgi:hypothetical protein